MYIHDIERFTKNKKELETLIQTAGIYYKDIRMEVGKDKRAMLEMKSVNEGRNEATKLRKNQNARRKRNTGSWHHQ